MIAILYTVITYLTGVWVGFYSNPSILSGDRFLRYFLPIIVIIIATELIRSVLLAQKNKIVSVLAFLIGILADLAIGQGIAGVTSLSQFMDVVGLTFFPAITSGMLCQHLVKRYGPVSTIVYRLLLTLPAVILPLTPAIPEVITSFVLVFLPLAVRMFIDLLYEKKQKYATRQRASRWSFVSFAATFLCMVTLVILISGQFQYKLLVIATPSMTGSLDVGDAVIYEEYDGDVIEEGDIVVFTKDDQTFVVHRVVGVEYYDGTLYYTTKGDANLDADDGYVTSSQIRGIVKLNLPHVGHTSLWLRDLFT